MLKYSINRPVSNVIVFGCGGTGSRAVPLLAQLLASSNYTKNVRLVLVDGDEVEEKNCKRQHFIKQEIGKKKSDVLARRYKLGFEARVESCPHFVPSMEEQDRYVRGLAREQDMVCEDSTRAFFLSFFTQFMPAGIDPSIISSVPQFEEHIRRGDIYQSLNTVLLGNTSVLVMCVDSIDARRRILHLVQTMSYMLRLTSKESLANMIIIDAGNEDVFGQVSYYNPVIPTLCPIPDLLDTIPDRVPYSTKLRYVPMPIGSYIHRKEGPVEKSCGDMDQTLAINNLMAGYICTIFQNLLYGMDMDFHTIHCNLNGSFFTSKMTHTWLKGVLSTDTNYMKGVVDAVNGEAVDLKKIMLAPENLESKFAIANSMYTGLSVRDTAHAHEGNFIRVDMDGERGVHETHEFGIGKRALLYTSSAPNASLRNLSEVPPNSAVTGEFFNLWKYTNYAHANWANLVWPVIAGGLKSKFMELSDTVKKAAVMSYGLTLGYPIFYRGASQAGKDSFNRQHRSRDTWGLKGPHWAIVRTDLVNNLKLQMDQAFTKDMLKINGEIDFLEDRLVVPVDKTSFMAGCNLQFNPGGRDGNSVSSTFLTICSSILGSLSPKEIQEIYQSILSTYSNGRREDTCRLLMKDVEYLVLSRESVVDGYSVVVDRSVKSVKLYEANNWYGMRALKDQGVTVLCDNSWNVFGEEFSKAESFITVEGKVIKAPKSSSVGIREKELKKLVFS